MQYKSPTYLAVKSRIEQDLSALPAVLRLVLAVMWAKVIMLLHAYLEWSDAQNSPLTCSLERLADYGTLYSVDRLNAFKASGSIIVTGNIGAFVLLDELLRADNGLDYVVTEAVELSAGDNLVPVRCTTSGRSGNLTAGSVLTFIEPLSGVDNETTVYVSGLSGGEETEQVEPWRSRIVDEWQVVTEYGGRSGKPRDYVAWAKKAHPSVTGALVYENALGDGTVLVRPICNGLDGRLPTQTIIDAIAAKYQELAPATADWRLANPLQHLFNVNLSLDSTVDNESNRALIETAIGNLVLSENSKDSVIYQAELDAAIATVTTQYTRNAPSSDVVVNQGAVFVLNSVVFA